MTVDELRTRQILNIAKNGDDYYKYKNKLKKRKDISNIEIEKYRILPYNFDSLKPKEKELFLNSVFLNILGNWPNHSQSRDSYIIAKHLYVLAPTVTEVFSKKYNEEGGYYFVNNKATYTFNSIGKSFADIAINSDTKFDMSLADRVKLFSYRGLFYANMGDNYEGDSYKFYNAAMRDFDRASYNTLNLNTEIKIMEKIVENIDTPMEVRTNFFEMLIDKYKAGIDYQKITINQINSFVDDIKDDIFYIANKGQYDSKIASLNKEHSKK